MSACLQFPVPGVRTLMPPRPWEINRDIFGIFFFQPNQQTFRCHWRKEGRAEFQSKLCSPWSGVWHLLGFWKDCCWVFFASFLKYHTFFRAVQLPRCRNIRIDACPQRPVSLFINNTHWWEQVKARTSDSRQDNMTVESARHSSSDFINKGTRLREGVFVLFEEGWFLVLFCFA